MIFALTLIYTNESEYNKVFLVRNVKFVYDLYLWPGPKLLSHRRQEVPLELENIMYNNVINTHFTLCLYNALLDGELDGEP